MNRNERHAFPDGARRKVNGFITPPTKRRGGTWPPLPRKLRNSTVLNRYGHAGTVNGYGKVRNASTAAETSAKFVV